jgi:DNA recombination protein RmuC
MQISIEHGIALAIGLMAGGLVIWLVLKGKIALAESQGLASGEIERVTLSEQLKAVNQSVGELRERLTSAELESSELNRNVDDLAQQKAQLTEQVKAATSENTSLSQRLADEEAAKTSLQSKLETVSQEKAQLHERSEKIPALEAALNASQLELNALKEQQSLLKSTIAELKTTIDAERTQGIEKLNLLNEARENLSNQFKALANEILDEKSKKFTEQNQVNLGQLLTPLKQQLTDFKTKVEEVYVNEGKDRSALAEQVKQLMQMNTNLSEEAHNLTLALKGDSKAQGNYGEIILDDVLDKAGLQAGVHYERQGSIVTDDGAARVIPDVVIHLPGARHLIVDSKMTLPDYSIFSSTDDKEEQSAALKRHLGSLRSHIKGLSEKNYQNLYGIKTLDFVIMFVPLEPAFMMAVTHDSELFQQAWEKNVLLVSPSTLLFVVRTVAYLWRQEDQSRNAQEIAKRGAELYDKLCGFVADLDDLGKQLGQAQNSFDKAKGKLHTGKGNVIRQAEMLKELGVRPTKSLPQQLTESAAVESELLS